MFFEEKWIWLPESKYPDRQNCRYNAFCSNDGFKFTVAEFKKDLSFKSKVKTLKIYFSADTECQLFLNRKAVATGPASVGGDFLFNEKPRDNYYTSALEIYPDNNTLEFFARVKMMPVKICEYSKGHGGFMLCAEATFEDGDKAVITTDESWLVRKNGAYLSPYAYDSSVTPDEYTFAEVTENIWHTALAPIPVRDEQVILPICENKVVLAPEKSQTFVFEFDKIYAGFLSVSVKAEGIVKLDVACKELDEKGSGESLVFSGGGSYRGFALHSVGKFVITAENEAKTPAEIEVGLIATNYPIEKVAVTRTDDEELNKLLDVCRHALKYCRQTHHLDSPRHQEPLACTGDYYIESLMTAFSFGDMRLAEFDIIRTAEMLKKNDGRMFHTTYSLIWTLMLWDVYLYTGNKKLLEDCLEALGKLLDRFKTYVGENALIETPPDYMFVDWIYIDGLSLHHPPKALGQTCLNMFYFGALTAAAKIYAELSDNDKAEACIREGESLKKAINTLLFDGEKGLYFEGLNTPTPEHLIGKYMPQNTDKRYYLKQSNILSAYFGISDDETAKNIIDKIMTDVCPGDYQPYFAHYLLEGVFRLGLKEKYTLKILEKWKPSVAECDKGLVEGFVAPEPTYVFDHSHAWAGTPLYSLPKALLGLEIIKPGLKEIKLSPSLLGLDSATAVLPTPVGEIVLKMKKGQKDEIICPEGVKLNIE